MLTTEEAVLQHFGVKGMKWGKRKGVTTNSSTDHTEAQALKKKPVNEMTNADLKKLNERLQLELTHSQLMAKQPTAIKTGQGYLKKAFAMTKTQAVGSNPRPGRPTTCRGATSSSARDSTHRFFKFSIRGDLLEPLATNLYPDGTAVLGDKLWVKQLDSSGSVAWLYSLTNSGTVLHRLMLI